MDRKGQNLNSGLPTVTSMCTLYIPTFVCLFMLFPLPGMLFPQSLYIEIPPMHQIQLSHALLQGQSKIPLMSIHPSSPIIICIATAFCPKLS